MGAMVPERIASDVYKRQVADYCIFEGECEEIKEEPKQLENK